MMFLLAKGNLDIRNNDGFTPIGLCSMRILKAMDIMEGTSFGRKEVGFKNRSLFMRLGEKKKEDYEGIEVKLGEKSVVFPS